MTGLNGAFIVNCFRSNRFRCGRPVTAASAAGG